jgi:hypothetical protein
MRKSACRPDLTVTLCRYGQTATDGVKKLQEGQSIRYLSGAEFQAQTIADYRFKGELIQRLGLGAQ